MIEKLIEKYCIQQVGTQYSDMIISKKDFIKAVNEFNALGYCVVEVSWWKHNKVGEVLDNFSMGGPVDKRNETYFFGETNFNKNFENNNLSKNLEYVSNYFNEFVSNDKHDLYPSISLEIPDKNNLR